MFKQCRFYTPGSTTGTSHHQSPVGERWMNPIYFFWWVHPGSPLWEFLVPSKKNKSQSRSVFQNDDFSESEVHVSSSNLHISVLFIATVFLGQIMPNHHVFNCFTASQCPPVLFLGLGSPTTIAPTVLQQYHLVTGLIVLRSQLDSEDPLYYYCCWVQSHIWLCLKSRLALVHCFITIFTFWTWHHP